MRELFEVWLRKQPLTIACWILYSILFVNVYEAVGAGVGALTLVVVSLLAWYWGLWGGLAAGVISFIVNGLLYAHVGVVTDHWAEVVVPGIPGVVIGGFVGYTKLLQRRLKSQQRLIIRKSEQDDLTGIYNRSTFVQKLEEITASNADGGTGVLFVDLDDFKAVNDTYGHAVGDAVLEVAARRLVETARGDDPVGRIGGDEFAVVASRLANGREVATLAERLLAELNRPYVVEGLSLKIAASIGISLHPDDGDSGQQLLRHADTALYRVKRKGKNGICLFNPELDNHISETHQLQFDLQGALLRGEFELLYQPQFALPDRRLVGVEALLRWNHPHLGQIPPVGFLSIIESNGMILPVGEWVIEQACRQLAEWRRLGHEDLTVAVNLSAMQLSSGTLVASVRRALESSGLPAAGLELEVTESVLAKDIVEASRILAELVKLGVHVSLDDFGTGYSSLNILRRLPFGSLKTDRSLVNDLQTSEHARSILRAVSSLAHELGLEMVAEGVETDEQLCLVEEFGCDYVQGFLFARPLDVRGLGPLLDEFTTPSRPDAAGPASERVAVLSNA